MKQRIFEENLYLFIKGELSASEMKEMKKEIQKSPKNKMLYEKMNGFLRDSKRLMKKVEIKQLENNNVLHFKQKAKMLHHKKTAILKSLSVAASFLLLLGLIYLSFENDNTSIKYQNENNKRVITDQSIKKPYKEIIASEVDEIKKSNRISQRIETMTADLNIVPRQKTEQSYSPPVKRIVYLTDDPKVKIYWMTN